MPHVKCGKLPHPYFTWNFWMIPWGADRFFATW